MSGINKNSWVRCLIWTLLGASLFVNLYRPSQTVYDEHYYIPAAKTWAQHLEPINREHPPLAKWIISWSAKLPFGNPEASGIWRVFPALFGLWTAYILLILLRKIVPNTTESEENWLLLYLVLSPVFIVQSRIAMIEPVFTLFTVLAVYGFIARQGVMLCALATGLAMGSKWSGVFLFGALIFLYAVRTKDIGLLLKYFFISLGTYFLTFTTYAFLEPITLKKILWEYQYTIYSLQKRVITPHPWHSHWWQWPLGLRGIWLFSDHTETHFRYIFMIPNLALTTAWSVGFIKNIYHLFNQSFKAVVKNPIAQVIFLILALWIPWAVLTRKNTYYYYFYPSFLMGLLFVPRLLSNLKTLPKWLINLTILGCGIFFLPLTYGWKIPKGSLGLWIWIRTWL